MKTGIRYALAVLLVLACSMPAEAQNRKGGAALDARIDTLAAELDTLRTDVDSIFAILATPAPADSALEARLDSLDASIARLFRNDSTVVGLLNQLGARLSIVEARVDSIVQAGPVVPPDTVPPPVPPDTVPTPPAVDTVYMTDDGGPTVTITFEMHATGDTVFVFDLRAADGSQWTDPRISPSEPARARAPFALTVPKFDSPTAIRARVFVVAAAPGTSPALDVPLTIPALAPAPIPPLAVDSLTVYPERFIIAVGDSVQLYGVLWNGSIPLGCDGNDLAEVTLASSSRGAWIATVPDSLPIGGGLTSKPDSAAVRPGGIRYVDQCNPSSGGGGGDLLRAAARYPIAEGG